MNAPRRWPGARYNVAMNTPLPVVRLKNAWRSSHPWIFQKLVEKPAAKPKSGTIVDVVGVDGEWIGRGFYNGHSRIAVRILETRPEVAVDQAWFAEKIAQAVSLRRDVLKLDETSDAWRVVHSEGDGLSGLVVDRYGDLIVVEFFAAGMFRHREWIYDALRAQFPGCRFHSFADEHVQKQESFDFHGNTTTEPAVITEHGIKFREAAARNGSHSPNSLKCDLVRQLVARGGDEFGLTSESSRWRVTISRGSRMAVRL